MVFRGTGGGGAGFVPGRRLPGRRGADDRWVEVRGHSSKSRAAVNPACPTVRCAVSEEESFPPAPWRLCGDAVMVIARVGADAARSYPAPSGVKLVSAGRSTVGGILLARYDERATLPYHELIVFSGLARAAGKPAFVVSHIYVDSISSLWGGRAIWGLPKQLAEFDWGPQSIEVFRDGRRLIHASVRKREGRRLTLPLYAPVFGDRAGATVRAAGRGRLRGGPALARLDVPPTSPFAGLHLEGPHLAVAGSGLDLHFPAATHV